MKNALLTIGILIACSATLCAAQDRASDILPPSVKTEVNNVLSDVLNAIHVFSATDSVSSGFYSFKSDGEKDAKLDVLRVGVDYVLDDCKDAQFVPFFNGVVGNVKLTDRVAPAEGTGQSDFITVSTLSAGIGAGVDAKFWENVHLVPKMEFVYSHTSNNYDYNNEFSQTFIQPFDGDIFNWDVDAISYVPSIKLFYVVESSDKRVTVTPSVNYSHLYVDSFWTNSQILDVKSRSNVLKTKLSVGGPLGVSAMTMPLTGELFGARYDIYGDAREGIGFKSYAEVGFGLLAATNGEVPLFSKLGLVASYSWNSDFDGWRIGLEGDL